MNAAASLMSRLVEIVHTRSGSIARVFGDTEAADLPPVEGLPEPRVTEQRGAHFAAPAPQRGRQGQGDGLFWHTAWASRAVGATLLVAACAVAALLLAEAWL